LITECCPVWTDNRPGVCDAADIRRSHLSI